MKNILVQIKCITIFYFLVSCMQENNYIPETIPSLNPKAALNQGICLKYPVFRATLRASFRPHCQQRKIKNISGDLRNYFVESNEFKEAPECIKEVFKTVANETQILDDLCQPYVVHAGKGENPRNLSQAYEDCIDAIVKLSQQKSGNKLTIEEALGLQKTGKLAFHVTSSDKAEYTLGAGLDPRLGGHSALADFYRNTPEVGARYKEFKMPATGTTALTTDPLVASEYADIYNFASAEARIFAVRLDKVKRDSQDLSNIVTKEWIWSEDLVEIPRTHSTAFGLLSPTAARQARIKAESAKIYPSPTPQWIDPAIVKFSQDTVSGAGEIAESMKQTGWIDFEGKNGVLTIVKMANGSLTTLDNTRILAASRAGAFVKAVVKSESETLTASEAKRFTTVKNGTPKNWKQAVEFRVKRARSNKFKSKYPQGSYIVGSKE